LFYCVVNRAVGQRFILNTLIYMEQNNISEQTKSSILKTLAIIGFVTALGLVAWLSIQLVHLFPAALNSLASTAQSVNQYQETILDTTAEPLPLTLTSNTSLINNGEQVTINWSKARVAGTYGFSYECIEGISVSHVSELGSQTIDCETVHTFGDVTTATMAIESEKNRYADVPYTIGFVRPGDDRLTAQGADVVTVVNTDIASRFAQTADDVGATFVPSAPDRSVAISETVAQPDTSHIITQPVPARTPTVAYTTPVSDSNGYSDLGTSFIAMGEIINGAFVTGPVSVQNNGAVQFSVKNLGTKTSDEWNYSVILPNGQTHTAVNQRELKPNERAVITIGFPASRESSHTFVGVVDEDTDLNNDNNRFAQQIAFAN